MAGAAEPVASSGFLNIKPMVKEHEQVQDTNKDIQIKSRCKRERKRTLLRYKATDKSEE
jgi:hypothetical protein